MSTTQLKVVDGGNSMELIAQLMDRVRGLVPRVPFRLIIVDPVNPPSEYRLLVRINGLLAEGRASSWIISGCLEIDQITDSDLRAAVSAVLPGDSHTRRFKGVYDTHRREGFIGSDQS